MKSTRLIYISVYINIVSKAGASTVPSIGNATLTKDWRGRAHEREVKLHLVGVTRNPYHGLAWSSARTRGKVAIFGGPRATLTMDWRGRTCEREVKLRLFPTVRRDVQPFPWIGVVERANAR